MKQILFTLIFLNIFLAAGFLTAQDKKVINSNSILRMSTSEIEAICFPEDGYLIYNTDDCKLYVYRNCSLTWTEVQLGTNIITPAFRCGDDLIDVRDNQTYKTVQIGNQCWMAENLNIGNMVNGNVLQSNNDIIEKYCYDNIRDHCGVYGGLYQWNEMMQYKTTLGIQGICPQNWLLPTDIDWCILEKSVDSTITCSST
ncbi:MAG: hypothetical protein K8R53_05605, partial [Bacteroidales bacterium]|nr:hypothetical protein [Bacteroidales bacterium]